AHWADRPSTGASENSWQTDDRCHTVPDRTPGHRLCAGGARDFSQSVSARESADGGAARNRWSRRVESRPRAAVFSSAGRTTIPWWPAAFRWRATDALDWPRPDDQPEFAHPR